DFLPDHLPSAGEKPINENRSRVRMRRPAHQREPAIAIEANAVAGLLEVRAIQLAYRHSVFARVLHVGTTDAQSKLAGCQPVSRLPAIARHRDDHLAQQALYEIGSEPGIVIDRRQSRETGADPLEHSDLALPLRVKEIPVRAEGVGLRRLGIVVDTRTANSSFIEDNLLGL